MSPSSSSFIRLTLLHVTATSARCFSHLYSNSLSLSLANNTFYSLNHRHLPRLLALLPAPHLLPGGSRPCAVHQVSTEDTTPCPFPAIQIYGLKYGEAAPLRRKWRPGSSRCGSRGSAIPSSPSPSPAWTNQPKDRHRHSYMSQAPSFLAQFWALPSTRTKHPACDLVDLF